MLRRNGPVINSVETVLGPEKILWSEKFVKEVGFEPGVSYLLWFCAYVDEVS